ncbi:Protein of unknown function [Bacillus thuringiensis]|uniref:Uncharacterized protein n=1 Tax=Bacillus thuringiensis TaxID=1428 RepID=A0A1C4DL71_BACTU|nr:Protein of unknown function [Bacillus thuringiensis]
MTINSIVIGIPPSNASPPGIVIAPVGPVVILEFTLG